MEITKLIELLKEDAWLTVVKIILKKLFINKWTIPVYQKIWQILQIILLMAIFRMILSFVLKGKFSDTVKMGVAVFVMVGVAILAYSFLNKSKPLPQTN